MPIGEGMQKHSCLMAALCLLAMSAAAEPQTPIPSGLEDNVRFWSRIYSEVDGQGGLLHDDVELGVVYEEIRFPAGLSSRGRERHVDRVRKKIRTALRTLGQGKRSGLSAEQARILALWPKNVSNKTLRSAANRVRFQLGQADKFKAGLERQGQWMDHVVEVLARYEVPEQLTALPHVESSYNARAYSRVGAAGLWQFTRPTGKRYLRIDNVVDERLDPHKATVAAARLLRDNYRRLESWPLAITAYNHGVSGMVRAVRKLGTKDLGVIARRHKSRTFGFASRNFYAEFVAASEIDQNPERFFGKIERHRPEVVDIIEMPHFIPATSLASAFKIDLDDLRNHNPALRPSVWSHSKYVPKGYSLRVPRGAESKPTHLALAEIPASERKNTQHRDRLYKVRRGDTLGRIAQRYETSVRKLVNLNNLRSRHKIRVGQVLVLPDDAAGSRPAPMLVEIPKSGVHTVGRGDSISRIATRYGLREQDLVAWNNLRNRHHIARNQKLRLVPPVETPIPAKAAKTSTPAVTTTAKAPEPEKPAATATGATPDSPSKILQTAALPSDTTDSTVDADDQSLAEPVSEETHGPPRAQDTPSSVALLSALRFELSDEASNPSDDDGVVEGVDAEQVGMLVATFSETPETSEGGSAKPNLISRRPPDPSDYAVSNNGTIVVQADETLGHYADWLDVRTSRLRHLNRIRSNSTVVIGRRTKLDLSRVDAKTFERRRLEYHRTLQEEFFGSFSITGTHTYELKPGDSLWRLARQEYKLPVWLLRQFNPDMDFAALTPGERMVIPNIEPRQT
ncbi:LysM peptidoglycan-binding domain-containing protein [Myxococcota bacterium]|nr:LysM peptidoglycan-binding domain-containing protein [Myxococcota bacterium]